MRKKLKIEDKALKNVNEFLTSPNNELLEPFFDVVEKYGTVEEINNKAEKASMLENQIARLKQIKSPYLKDIEWLIKQKNNESFVSIDEYRKNILGARMERMNFNKDFAVTLEISAFQYFPWLITQAHQAIKNREVMPGRFIRVRNMKEQATERGGDELIAVAAAMNIIGATYVETLDTKGTDGSNIHLGGPETITGYFGGVGEPNKHALKWLDEFLYYYTNYGIKQVLNINSGTILLSHFLRKIGIKNEFKISVYMGKDNPYSILATFTMARLFLAEDGSSALVGFNLSNSVDNETIEISAKIRQALGLEDIVRFELHIIEAYKGIVKQPYNRRKELIKVAKKVKNISAKHEGGELEIEKQRDHPSNILDYFLSKEDVLKGNLMNKLERNYLDKHNSMNITAKELTENGIDFIAARNLHYNKTKNF